MSNYNFAVQPNVIQKLIELNRAFYQRFAAEFDATRHRLQPGVMKILGGIAPDARILDLGCGNGELWRQLARRGQRAPYVGLDFSERLVETARRDLPAGWRLEIRDLAAENWAEGLPAPFEVIVAFAVFHHLPAPLMPGILEQCRGLLAPGGRLALSCWQFLASSHWRGRIQPWARAGLAEGELSPGDYLLDWRRGGTGYRYVHFYHEAELAGLAAQAGFTVRETFYSDGQGGNLGLYQVWEPQLI